MSEREVRVDLVVAGGGAAGFFAAITAAELAPGARVLILEKSREVLGKVRISGGGRCNVTHACFEPRALSEFYPRGAKALIGPFHRWGPTDTIEWYAQREVTLKKEADGRMFPDTDSSQTIIDCLIQSAVEAGVEIWRSCGLKELVEGDEGGFLVTTTDAQRVRADQVLLALGGTRNRLGADLAQQWGHRVVEAAPSLFTFKITDPRIDGLQGLAVANAEVAMEGSKLRARGPVLVTHWGLSGPGILRVSAWGARELQNRDYRFKVRVNWTGDLRREQVLEEFSQLRLKSKKKVINDARFGIPSRLWRQLVEAGGGDFQGNEVRWAHLPKPQAVRLADDLVSGVFQVEGKSLNKDEFVTCGGVHLGDVNFKTMESRIVPGLFFAGEILDVDGITGGFNFQAAWTTGRIAGETIAARVSGTRP
ncbi:MAG: aminoacetone oxidase family FAD-binding enzyme [Verrucomicrobiales bacterium]